MALLTGSRVGRVAVSRTVPPARISSILHLGAGRQSGREIARAGLDRRYGHEGCGCRDIPRDVDQRRRGAWLQGAAAHVAERATGRRAEAGDPSDVRAAAGRPAVGRVDGEADRAVVRAIDRRAPCSRGVGGAADHDRRPDAGRIVGLIRHRATRHLPARRSRSQMRRRTRRGRGRRGTQTCIVFDRSSSTVLLRAASEADERRRRQHVARCIDDVDREPFGRSGGIATT